MTVSVPSAAPRSWGSQEVHLQPGSDGEAGGHGAHRLSKSTAGLLAFKGEAEAPGVSPFLACLQGKAIPLSSFAGVLKVSTAEFKMDFTSRHDWDSFTCDGGANETPPGEAEHGARGSGGCPENGSSRRSRARRSWAGRLCSRSRSLRRCGRWPRLGGDGRAELPHLRPGGLWTWGPARRVSFQAAGAWRGGTLPITGEASQSRGSRPPAFVGLDQTPERRSN